MASGSTELASPVEPNGGQVSERPVGAGVAVRGAAVVGAAVVGAAVVGAAVVGLGVVGLGVVGLGLVGLGLVVAGVGDSVGCFGVALGDGSGPAVPQAANAPAHSAAAILNAVFMGRIYDLSHAWVGPLCLRLQRGEALFRAGEAEVGLGRAGGRQELRPVVVGDADVGLPAAEPVTAVREQPRIAGPWAARLG